jgi:hypothetical protein
MELPIKKFKSLTELFFEKDNLRRRHDEWMTRQMELRDFYNGRPIEPEADNDREDDASETEIDLMTNRLIGYSNMQVVQSRIYAMWATGNKLIDVNIHDEELTIEERESQSEWVNKWLNKAIFQTSRFGAFWRGVSGEIALAGRVPAIFKEDADWCPSIAPKLLLPDDIGTDASGLTYALAPKELTYTQLENLLDDEGEESEEDDEGDSDDVKVNNDVIKQLMATIDHQITGNDTQMNVASEKEKMESSDSDSCDTSNRTTANVWYYYEVRYDEEKKSKVVDLLIASDEFRNQEGDGESTSQGSESKNTQEWVAFYPAYYSSPYECLHLIVSDASIGGDKTFANAKGIAEITYGADLDSEELLDRIVEGEKMRAVPRFQEGAEANDESMLGWDPSDTSLVPQGLQEFRFQGNTGGLNNPLGLLQNISARQSGGAVSNSERGGELRQQSVERQSLSRSSANVQTSDLFKSLEILAYEMVRRFFVGETEGGSPGYEEIMWFRHKMKQRRGGDVDLKRLAEQVFGFYEHIDVKVARSSSTARS